MEPLYDISFRVNGEPVHLQVTARTSLADALREELALTGTHLGCEQGVCGACTVLVDGASVRSCLLLAVQAEGADVRTVEGLSQPDGGLHPIQEAFFRRHAFQCGFCTPGFLMTTLELLGRGMPPDEAAVREALSGNICRCTGYEAIVEAVLELLREGSGT
jgi:carbon-monoxide dehydrogenase small subunit